VWCRGGASGWCGWFAHWPWSPVCPPRNSVAKTRLCAGYGFHPGTDAFASCLQKESLARRYWATPPAPYWGWGINSA
jgi:hypothetical protein